MSQRRTKEERKQILSEYLADRSQLRQILKKHKVAKSTFKQRLICHVLRPTGSERKVRSNWRRVSISNYASKNTAVC